jgi:hypothetical protein
LCYPAHAARLLKLVVVLVIDCIGPDCIDIDCIGFRCDCLSIREHNN